MAVCFTQNPLQLTLTEIIVSTDKKKVLIVEDEKVICTICRRVLGDKFEVDVTYDAISAQGLVKKKSSSTSCCSI